MSQIVFVITGPTASGKSSLALKVAQELNGEIINGDSKQMYQALPILTAQPAELETKKIKHHLYGVLENHTHNTMDNWRRMALDATQDVLNRGKTPIIVGGSGMYVNALTEGMAEIPNVSDETKKKCENIINTKGLDALTKDLEMANAKAPADPQRLMRAWHVLSETGKPLEYWHTQKKHKPPADWKFIKILLMPERSLIHKKVEKRLHIMLESGAIEEVKNLLSENHPENAPVMKSLGVTEIEKYLEGDLTKEQAFQRILELTRQYVKRQSTWFKHQFNPDFTLTTTDILDFQENLATIEQRFKGDSNA